MEPLTRQYAKSVVQDRWTVCGRTLLPLTIGHVVLLDAVGSPLADVTKSVEAGQGDLLLGVWICSRPWDRAALTSRLTALRLQWSARVWRGRLWTVQRFRLASYLVNAWTGPRVWETPQPDAMPDGSPLTQRLILHRMMHLHQSWEAAMATPLQAALWDFSAWASGAGRIRIFSELDAAALEAARRADTETGAGETKEARA